MEQRQVLVRQGEKITHVYFPTNAVVALAVGLMCCEAGALKNVALQSTTWMVKLFRHEQRLFAEAQQSSACMAMDTAEARICRCLLICRDL